jgi:hypothetical protein
MDLYVFFIPLYFARHVSGAICTHPQERDKISPLKFEGHFTAHVTEGVRMFSKFPWHDDLYKTLQ